MTLWWFKHPEWRFRSQPFTGTVTLSLLPTPNNSRTWNVVLYYYMSPWRVKHYQNWNLDTFHKFGKHDRISSSNIISSKLTKAGLTTLPLLNLQLAFLRADMAEVSWILGDLMLISKLHGMCKNGMTWHDVCWHCETHTHTQHYCTNNGVFSDQSRQNRWLWFQVCAKPTF